MRTLALMGNSYSTLRSNFFPYRFLSSSKSSFVSAAVMPMQCTSIGDQERTVVLQPVPELDVFDPADPEVGEPPDACVLLGGHRERRTDQRSKHVTRLVLQIGGVAERPLAPGLVVDAAELVECRKVVIPDRRVQLSF